MSGICMTWHDVSHGFSLCQLADAVMLTEKQQLAVIVPHRDTWWGWLSCSVDGHSQLQDPFWQTAQLLCKKHLL